MRKPLFIAIEGGEGSGKSSLLRSLKEKIGDSVLMTREPGGSLFGEVIRDAALKHPLSKEAHAETMICLMFASRYDHVHKIIVPTLERGQHIITDRFDASSYAYNVHGQDAEHIEDLFWKLRGKIARLPDLYIYIKVDPEEGIRRASSRNAKVLLEGNHFDERELNFHKKIRKGYSKFFKKVKSKVKTLDANRPFKQVEREFVGLIEKILK